MPRRPPLRSSASEPLYPCKAVRPSCPEFRNEYCVPGIRRSAGILPAILRPRRPRPEAAQNSEMSIVSPEFAGARASCPLSCGRDGRAPTGRGTGLEDSSPETILRPRRPRSDTPLTWMWAAERYVELNPVRADLVAREVWITPRPMDKNPVRSNCRTPLISYRSCLKPVDTFRDDCQGEQKRVCTHPCTLAPLHPPKFRSCVGLAVWISSSPLCRREISR